MSDEVFDEFVARGRLAQMESDRVLLAQLVDELHVRASFTVTLRPAATLAVAGLLQLALRQPDVSVGTARVGRMCIDRVRAYFDGCPAALEILHRGDPAITSDTYIGHLRADVANGGRHRCEEWIAADRCLLCDRLLP